MKVLMLYDLVFKVRQEMELNDKDIKSLLNIKFENDR